MLVFIDESGDAGFKVGKGSSRYFVVTLVIFEENLDAEVAAVEIKKLRRSLGKSESFEFKFNKMNKLMRVAFLNVAKTLNFKSRSVVFDKTILYSRNLIGSTEKFYNYAVKVVLENNNESIKNAKVRLDGLGEREFKKQLNVYLRKNLNKGSEKIMENLKFVDSKENVLIQLADMVAGSIHRSLDSLDEDAKDYLKIIKAKCEDIWKFK